MINQNKWFKGQKVKLNLEQLVWFNNREKQKASRQTWFREKPLPVPVVDKKQMLISFKGGSSKIAILEGATLVEYYTAESKSKSLVGNIYLESKNILPGMEAAFVSFGEEKNGVLYVADVAGSKKFKDRKYIKTRTRNTCSSCKRCDG